VPEAVTLNAPDGAALEGELTRAPGAPSAGMVLCHPHPQYGGSMRSIVIGALFEALPPSGVTCLRFNFRGVEGSGGVYDEGRAERGDVATAVDRLATELGDTVPLVLAGWSFGADMALSVRDPAVSAWFAVAPPFHFTIELDELARDPRPKLFALAEHDEVRPAGETRAIVEGWDSTAVEVVAGASHFFVGRTDRLVELARAFVARVAG